MPTETRNPARTRTISNEAHALQMLDKHPRMWMHLFAWEAGAITEEEALDRLQMERDSANWLRDIARTRSKKWRAGK